jgi:hypothetical protein
LRACFFAELRESSKNALDGHHHERDRSFGNEHHIVLNDHNAALARDCGTRIHGAFRSSSL